MQGKLFAFAEGLTSYVVAFFFMSFGALVENASTVMALGGLVLLCLRIYVDSVNAKQAYRQSKRMDAEYEQERSN